MIASATFIRAPVHEKTNWTTVKAAGVTPGKKEYLAPPRFKRSALLPSAASFRQFLSHRCSSYKLLGMG